MNAQTDPRDHWREQIESLDAQLATAEQAREDAQTAASAAALEGGDLDGATRELALVRDRLDALRAARGEAERHLALADHAAAQRERDKALERAASAARKRIEIGDQIDSYLAALDPLLVEWVAASNAFARAMDEAGRRAPSRENLSGPHRIRAAAWTRAAGFMASIEAPRVSQDHKQSLRELSAAQAAPILAKGTDP